MKALFDNGQDYRSIVLNGSTEKAKVLTPRESRYCPAGESSLMAPAGEMWSRNNFV